MSGDGETCRGRRRRRGREAARQRRVTGRQRGREDRGRGHRTERVVEPAGRHVADRDRGLPVLAGVEVAGLCAGETDLVRTVDQARSTDQRVEREGGDARDQAEWARRRVLVLNRVATGGVVQRGHEVARDRVRTGRIRQRGRVDSCIDDVRLPTVGGRAAAAAGARCTGRRGERERGARGAGRRAEDVGAKRWAGEGTARTKSEGRD